MRLPFQTCFLVAAVFWVSASVAVGQPASSNIAPPTPPAGAKQPLAGMGIMAGEVSDRSALVQVRLTETDQLVDRDVPGAWGVVEFTLRPADGSADAQLRLVRALPERDFIARAHFADLQPGTDYICDTRFGPSEQILKKGPNVEFKTHPGATKQTQSAL